MSQRSLFDKFKAIFTKREALNTKPPGYSVPELTEEERQRLLDAGLAPVPKTEKEYKSDISFREIIYSFMEEYKKPSARRRISNELKSGYIPRHRFSFREINNCFRSALRRVRMEEILGDKADFYKEESNPK